MINDNEMSSSKNINEKWLDNIFDSLMKMKECEKRIWEGCSDLVEFLETNQIQLPIIQSKNYNLFILEAEILLADVKEQIDKTKLEAIKNKIKSLRKLEELKGGFLAVKKNDVEKTKKYYLKPSFQIAKEEISSIRELLVASLWKILTPNAKESMGDTPA